MVGLIACLVAAAPAGCGPRHAPLDFQQEEWSYGRFPGSIVSTPHYRVHTTCKDRLILDAIPRVLEGAYAEYARLLPSPQPLTQPLETYLFADRGQWESFTRNRTGPRAATYLRIRSGGYEENGVTVSHYSRRGITLSVLAHEGLHQYLTATNRRQLPSWLNEGLATRFESFEFDPEGWPVFKPRENTIRRQHLRAAVRKGRTLPLSELLSKDAGEALREGEQRSQLYYAQVWALTLYLLEPFPITAEREGFRRLLAELGTPAMSEMASRFRSAQSAANETDMSYEEAVFRLYVTHDVEGFNVKYEEYMRELVGM